MRTFLVAVIVSLSIVIACLVQALTRDARYSTQPTAQEQTDSRQQESKSNAQQRDEPKESWDIFGYRLKVTDTLVAVFTALLFFATLALYVATRGLVLGADKTAERQLRAYIYIDKTNLTYDNGNWVHSFNLKNFGLTPAHDVSVISRSEVVDWNDGHPTIPTATEVDRLGSIAPHGDFIEDQSSVNGVVTPDELNNGSKAVYLVGTITYSTIFEGPKRRTDFRYYAGGNMRYQGGEMYADEDGNNAT